MGVELEEHISEITCDFCSQSVYPSGEEKDDAAIMYDLLYDGWTIVGDCPVPHRMACQKDKCIVALAKEIIEQHGGYDAVASGEEAE